MGLTGDRPPGNSGWPGTEELLRSCGSLAAGRLCRPEQRRLMPGGTRAFRGLGLQACAEYLRPEAVSPWTWHLMFLHRLKKAGYPFRPNDLSLETWLLLGLVEEGLALAQGGHGANNSTGITTRSWRITAPCSKR
jgi:hypothetical protein